MELEAKGLAVRHTIAGNSFAVCENFNFRPILVADGIFARPDFFAAPDVLFGTNYLLETFCDLNRVVLEIDRCNRVGVGKKEDTLVEVAWLEGAEVTWCLADAWDVGVAEWSGEVIVVLQYPIDRVTQYEPRVVLLVPMNGTCTAERVRNCDLGHTIWNLCGVFTGLLHCCDQIEGEQQGWVGCR